MKKYLNGTERAKGGLETKTFINEDKIARIKILEEFRDGKFDAVAFGDEPRITEDLKKIIDDDEKGFLQRLFFCSKSDETLKYWFEIQKLNFPKNALGYGVCLGCNLPVIKYLKEKISFKDLDEEEKKFLLVRAMRFKGEGLTLLEEELGMKSSEINQKYLH